MHRRTIAGIILGAALGLAAMVLGCGGGGDGGDDGGGAAWHTIYSTDFTSDPAWTSSNDLELYWDSTAKTYHGTQMNSNASYAYKVVSNNVGRNFRLTYDLRINSAALTTGCTFGLADTTNLYPSGGAFTDTSWNAGGLGWTAASPAASHTDYTTPWSIGVWYTIQVTYDKVADTLAYTAKVKATGTLMSSFTVSAVGTLPLTMHRLELTRVHMAAGGASTVDYDLDNVRLEEYY